MICIQIAVKQRKVEHITVGRMKAKCQKGFQRKGELTMKIIKAGKDFNYIFRL